MNVKHIAQVIAGPHDPNGIYEDTPDTLSKLRKHKWDSILTEQERGEFLSMAGAVIRELTN